MKKITLLLFLITCFSTFSSTNYLEPLLGLSIDTEGIEFTVYTGGCTSKNSFEIGILESNPVQIELIRVAPDYCEAYIPEGVSLKYTWSEMGLIHEDRFFIRNPIALLVKPVF